MADSIHLVKKSSNFIFVVYPNWKKEDFGGKTFERNSDSHLIFDGLTWKNI